MLMVSTSGGLSVVVDGVADSVFMILDLKAKTTTRTRFNLKVFFSVLSMNRYSGKFHLTFFTSNTVIFIGGGC